MRQAGFMDLDFKLYFEPEEGINTPAEFTRELFQWANREKRDLVILEEGMEPTVRMDGTEYVCVLADPKLATQNNPLWKGLGLRGINHSVGSMLGYKWVYLYEK